MPLTPTAPAHGGQLKQVSHRFDIPLEELLDFSANINPDGPPASVFASLRASLEDPSTLGHYPDLEETQLTASIAAYACVPPVCVTVANGFVPLLETALRTLRLTSCLVPVPAFTEYRRTLERADVAVTPYLLSPQDNFHYGAQHLLDALAAGDHDALLLANPQNPSGILHTGEHLAGLIEAAAEKKVWVLLDEAFVDYAPTHSLAKQVSRLQNLLVFRSVTKFHGMPGMRVAYALAHPSTAQSLRSNLAPWPITTLASIAVQAALQDQQFITRTLLFNRQRRDHLVAQLNTLNIHSYPAAANFLLLHLPSHAEDLSSLWQRMICEHRLVLRKCSDFEHMPAAHVRCAIRNDKENARLVAALESII